MTGREQVLVGVGGKDPEPVGFSSKGLYSEAFADVPDTDSAILRIGDDEFVLRVEEHTGDVVGMPSHGVHLPGLGLIHAPELDLSIICPGDDERKCWVKGRPVDASLVTLKHVLHQRIVASEQLIVDTSDDIVLLHLLWDSSDGFLP